MTDWLQAHEEQVEAALKQLEGLRRERGKLAKRVAQLEEELGEAQAAVAGAGSWVKDRRTLRQRVQRLADGLEKALG